MNKKWLYRTGGIPDDMFIRSRVPMTKAEIRVITLAKARICEDHIIWDIGAGTGSISIEAALAAPAGTVFAVEKEEDALEILQKNIDLFKVSNIDVCPGTAPDALKCLPDPDRVIIGGSGGNLEEILSLVYNRLVSGGRVVVNAVVMETLIKAVESFKQLGYREMDITQVNISKTAEVGNFHMFKSHSPVFVISGEK